MKSILSTLAILGLAAVARADYLADFGTAAGEFNTGFCLAFQDDPTDTTTTCYSSCTTTATYIAEMFDVTYYTDSTFNTAELLQFGQETMIYLLTQFKDCKTTEFFFAIDNRLSDLSFATGTLANIGT
jgi:hypothetical protein